MPAVSSPMPVTTDSLLLAEFVELVPGQRILDIGFGSGIIALSLCARADVQVVGIDNSIEAYEEACRNLERERLLVQAEPEFMPGDLRNAEFMAELGQFDQVVCNPPYHRLNQGRLPPNAQRAAARHELTCTLEEVVRAASQVMSPRGVFSFSHIPARLPDAVAALASHDLSLQALQPVYTNGGPDARLLLFRAAKGAGTGPMRVLPALHVRTLGGI